MINEKQSNLKPTTLRLLLVFVLFGIAALGVFGFIFAQQKIASYAVEVSHKKIDASASKASLQTLEAIEKQLTADKETIEKAKSVKHSSNLPQFKAIQDLKNHAAANRITINDISFAATAAATPPATGALATPATPPAAASTDVDISFKINDGQVELDKFMSFLYDIEHSTPKMQIQGISVKKGSSKSNIVVDAITVRMFTKSG
jgi:cytoskeletal protein RodZ